MQTCLLCQDREVKVWLSADSPAPSGLRWCWTVGYSGGTQTSVSVLVLFTCFTPLLPLAPSFTFDAIIVTGWL